MEIDSDQDTVTSTNDDKTAWNRLYIVVVAALVAEVAFFAWLTKAFE